MKTLVISAIIAMTSLVNVEAQQPLTVQTTLPIIPKPRGRVETQTVFKSGESEISAPPLEVQLHLRQLRSHLPKKKVLKWNESTQSFEKHHSLNFFYTDDVTVEYALWNEQSSAYTDIKQKAVYRQTDSSVLRYLSYEWDEKNNDWSLTAPSHDG